MDTQYQDNEEVIDLTIYSQTTIDNSLPLESYKDLEIIQKNG